MTEKEIKPTKTQTRLLSRIKEQGGVFIDKKEGRLDQATFPNGICVPMDSIDRLIKRGWLIPNQDGLFPDVTQSYRVAP